MSEAAIFPRVPIKYVADVLSGGTPTSNSENWNGDVPFITPPDLNGLDGVLVKSWGRTVTAAGAQTGSTMIQNAVLISCRAPVGHIGVVRDEVSFNQGCKAVVPADDVDLSFISKCLVADREALQAASRGTTFTELSTTELLDHSIPWPARSIRRLIADYVDRETCEIDAMIDKLDELESTLAVRRADAIASQMLNYPKVALGIDCGIFNGSTPARSNTDYWSASPGTPWLNSSVVNQQIVLESNQYVSDLAIEKCHLPAVVPGDLLIGITGQGRTRGMVAKSGLHCTISQHLAAIRPMKLWDADFLHHALSAEYTELRNQSDWGGSTRGAITIESLSRYRISCPPLEEQRRIADHLDEVTSKIDTMLAKVSQLKDLLTERRAALITDVVTGRKDVA